MSQTKKYYGEQTELALKNFAIMDQKASLHWIEKILEVKKAANQANYDLGKIPQKEYELIEKAINKILAGGYDDQFVTSAIQGGAGTSINMNVNEVVANLAEEIGGGKTKIHYLNHVNLSQSTNDVLPTALKMALYELAGDCIESLEELEKSFGKKANEFAGVIKTGRTHLQDAVPVTLGQEFATYRLVAQRGIKRIENARKGMLELSIGGTAIGTGVNAGKKYVALTVKNLKKNTGLPVKSAGDLIDATQNADSLGDVSSAIKDTLIALSKIANDLRLMASGPKCGLAEIRLPERQKGSTIMPNKVNPVMPEMINQICFHVQGADLTVTRAIESGQFELNVFFSVLAYNLIESLTIFAKGIKLFSRLCVEGITPNVECCKNFAFSNTTLLTALTPELGYERVAEIIKKANKTNGKNIEEILMAEGVDKKLIAETLNIKKLTTLS